MKLSTKEAMDTATELFSALPQHAVLVSERFGEIDVEPVVDEDELGVRRLFGVVNACRLTDQVRLKEMKLSTKEAMDTATELFSAMVLRCR
jgi:hypothetical protein